jgi:transcriptional regulator with XRE-family HTH domain
MLATMSTDPGGIARLGRLVRVERQRQGLRQTDLARRARVSRNTITALESGKTQTPVSLPAILSALGLDVADVLVDSPLTTAPPGAAPPLAHLTDAQLGNEAIRLLAEMTARLGARPIATTVPPEGTFGVLSAVDNSDEDHPDTAR